MNQTRAIIFGVVICLAALAVWVYAVPAAGAGWILAFAFLATLGLLASIQDSNLGAVAGVIIAVGVGLIWYFNRQADHAGWVLALGVLSGFVAFAHLMAIVGSSTRPERSRKKRR